MLHKEQVLSNLPHGYVYLAEGEDMPEVSYYIYRYKEMSENQLS